jgi:hypothetical protein
MCIKMYWVRGLRDFQLRSLALGRGWMAECLRMKKAAIESLDARERRDVSKETMYIRE